MKSQLLLLVLILSQAVLAQVGIGTSTPQAELDVDGEMLVQEAFVIDNLGTVPALEENFKLTIRSKASTPMGKISLLDVDNLYVAPVNTVNYTFTNIQLDNLDDVDLQYDAAKYVIGIANFRHTGDAIKKVPGGNNFSIGHFVVRTFVSSGTWHLQIKNVELDLDAGDSLTYYVTLMVYDKKYFRQLPAITTNLGGSNIGVASSVPVFE